jgi:hypothetical protein
MLKLKSYATRNVRWKTVGRGLFLFASSKQYHISDLFKDAWCLQGMYVKCHRKHHTEKYDMLQEVVDVTNHVNENHIYKSNKKCCVTLNKSEESVVKAGFVLASLIATDSESFAEG